MAILKDLIVHGSSRFLNKIYAEELETSAFEAESAIIKKLTAKDATVENATVIGLLDVQGQLHTNTWTNSNIATIDGCFYITPTLSSDTGSIVFSSTSTASLAGTYTAVTSLYVGDATSGSTVQWTAGSNVLLTGQVKVNNEWIPLGTLLGTLSGTISTSAIGLSGLTDNRHNTSSIITDIRNAVSNTSLDYRNLKISLYQRKDGSDSKPIGIYMTAMGANGKTFIDIYGGVNATTTAGSSGGFADPNLRIGNLSGLSAVEGTTPTGWGIYTTNGYFKGVIVSSAGKIGNFTINSALYSNNHSAWNSNVSGIYINNDGISGGAGGKWWLWNDGSAKIGAMTLSAAGVLTVPAANVSGELTAATINGSKITANSITAGQIAASAITADELAANAVTSAKIKAGEVKATNIASGAITADKLDATTINASNKLTVGALTTATQNNILNSNIQIGGTNLLKNTDATTIAKIITIASTSSSSYSEGWTVTVTRIAGENTYTVSFDAKASEETEVNCYWYSPNTTTSSLSSTGQTSLSGDGACKVTLTTEWKRYWVTWTQNDTAATNKNLIVGRLSKPSSGTKTVEVRAIKFEVGNKATAWSPAPEEVDVRKYITDIDSNKGITIKPANTSGNDYLQINSSAINFYRNNVETLKIEDSAIRVGKMGENKQNVYITDGAVQVRDNEDILAKFGSDGVVVGDINNLNIKITNDRMIMYSKSTPSIQLITGDDVRPVTRHALYVTFPFSTVTTKTYVVNSENNNFFKYSTGIKALFDVIDSSNTVYDRLGRSFTFGTSASKTMSYDTPHYTFSCSCTIEYDGAYTFTIKDWTYSNIKRVNFYIEYDLEEAATNVILGTTTATSFGAYSVTEGDSCQASGENSHAEGNYSIATGRSSHVEGSYNTSSGNMSHAEGYYTESSGLYSHSQNYCTIAASNSQTAIGKYNISDSSDVYAFIIGNGESNNQRSNGLTVGWDGNVQMYLDAVNVELDNSILTAIQSLGWEDDVID